MKRNNLVGQKFGRLTVCEIARVVLPKQNVLWACLCECGGKADAYAYDLKSGRVKSCGCLIKEGAATKHGMARHGKARSSTYNIWAAMLQRCTNEKDAAYKHYGGRGIRAAEEWASFAAFFSDMGERPEGMSIERKDNNAGYNKENCVWASTSAQARNKRTTVFVIVGGEQVVFSGALKMLAYDKGNAYRTMKEKSLSHQEVIDLWLKRTNEKSKTA